MTPFEAPDYPPQLERESAALREYAVALAIGSQGGIRYAGLRTTRTILSG